MKVLLWDLGTHRDEYNEPLGIEMLAGALRRDIPEIDVQLRWENACKNAPYPNLAEFHIVGLSAKLGMFPLLTQILDTVRQMPRQPLIVLGDVIPTFAYKEVLARFPEVLCVLGEGETAIRFLVENVLRNTGLTPEVLAEIPNLAFSSERGVVVTSRLQEQAEVLPRPDRYFLKWTIEHRGILRIEGSRGCAWSACQFCCVQAKYGSRGWRPFPVASIIAQLSEISSLGGRGPYFSDEDFFGGDFERARYLAEAIIEAKRKGDIISDMNFFISARANDVVGPDAHLALLAMKRAGFREVFIGIESGSSVQLQRYGKHVTPDLNRQALATLRNIGMEIDIGYILFEPEATFEELEVNARYLYELDLVEHDARSIKDLRVQPLTGIAEKYTRNGMICGDLDLNALRYPVRYKDERVAWVRDRFAAYERQGIDATYRLQASCRGEVPNEHFRLAAKRCLGQIRKIDLEQLGIYIAYAGGKIDSATMKRSTTEHGQRRKELLTKLCSERSIGSGRDEMPQVQSHGICNPRRALDYSACTYKPAEKRSSFSGAKVCKQNGPSLDSQDPSEVVAPT